MKTTPKALILIVEDEPTRTKSYQTILQTAGYQVQAAGGGQALAMATETKPALILLDIRKPQADGLKFLQQYDLAQHPEVRVIVFSNDDDRTIIDKAYRLGADHYILKTWLSEHELLQITANTLTYA